MKILDWMQDNPDIVAVITAVVLCALYFYFTT